MKIHVTIEVDDPDILPLFNRLRQLTVEDCLKASAPEIPPLTPDEVRAACAGYVRKGGNRDKLYEVMGCKRVDDLDPSKFRSVVDFCNA